MSAQDTTYLGWSNADTWHAAAVLDNVLPLYEQVQALLAATRNPATLAGALERLCRDADVEALLAPHGQHLDQVVWAEVAASLLDASE